MQRPCCVRKDRGTVLKGLLAACISPLLRSHIPTAARAVDSTSPAGCPKVQSPVLHGLLEVELQGLAFST